jgi:small subunit ribosomal protein S5
VKATFDALKRLSSPRAVAARRGKKVGELIGRRDGQTAAAGAEARE